MGVNHRCTVCVPEQTVFSGQTIYVLLRQWTYIKSNRTFFSVAGKWIAFILSLDTLSNFHSSIYLSARAFMCHSLLSLEISVETMVPLQHFLLFCLCSAKHDGTNEPIKCAGGCAVPRGKLRNWDGLISSEGRPDWRQTAQMTGVRKAFVMWTHTSGQNTYVAFLFGILVRLVGVKASF